MLVYVVEAQAEIERQQGREAVGSVYETRMQPLAGLILILKLCHFEETLFVILAVVYRIEIKVVEGKEATAAITDEGEAVGEIAIAIVAHPVATHQLGIVAIELLVKPIAHLELSTQVVLSQRAKEALLAPLTSQDCIDIRVADQQEAV